MSLKTGLYIVIFHGILDSLPSPPQVQRVVLDHEEAIWRAIRTVMPNIHVQDCAFHFTHAVYRHVQQLGLQQANQTAGGTSKFTRRLIWLYASCLQITSRHCLENMD